MTAAEGFELRPTELSTLEERAEKPELSYRARSYSHGSPTPGAGDESLPPGVTDHAKAR
jgi:hypothetical protein